MRPVLHIRHRRHPTQPREGPSAASDWYKRQLRGKVLPVGGIKEKILAAKRAGISDIILSDENRRDVEDINERYLAGLNFHYVSTVLDVMKTAITDVAV